MATGRSRSTFKDVIKMLIPGIFTTYTELAPPRPSIFPFPYGQRKKLEGQVHNLPALCVGLAGRIEMAGFYEISPSDTSLALSISGRNDPFDRRYKEKGPLGRKLNKTRCPSGPFSPLTPIIRSFRTNHGARAE